MNEFLKELFFIILVSSACQIGKGTLLRNNAFDINRGWFAPGNGYQYFQTTQKMTYIQAASECEGWGGSLAFHGIRNRFYFRKIINYFTSSVWVGLDDRRKEGKFQWADKRSVYHGWMYPWHFLQSDRRFEEDCVVLGRQPCTLSLRKLMDVSCSLKYFGLCERSVGLSSQYNFTSSDGSMFMLITSETMYTYAKKECQDWGGKLAEQPITNAKLAQELADALYNDPVSLKSMGSWVGLTDVESEGVLVLNSQHKLNISSINWDSSSNSNLKNCAVFDSRSGKIRLESCRAMKTALCEKKAAATDFKQVMPLKCLPAINNCSLNRYPSIDGVCHNLLNTDWGREKRPFKRMLPPSYDDGVGSPRGGFISELPSARAIIQKLKGVAEPASTFASHQLPLWGQFFAHDITKLGELKDKSGAILLPCPCGDSNPECFNIPIPEGDPVRKQMSCYSFVRAEKVPDVNCDATIRQQENRVTSYIDASNVYGSNEKFLNNLRTDNGLLKIGDTFHSHYHSLPFGTQVSSNIHSQFECEPIHFDFTDKPCFAGGDIRVNEQAALASGHTMWLRKHNQIATELGQLNPHWDGDKIFFTARSIITALHQQITYDEFLPVLLGDTNMKRFGLKLTRKGYYYGYDANYDSTIDISFATAALRLGHTLIKGVLSRPNPDYSKNLNRTNIDLRTQFFDGTPLYEKDGIGDILRGIVSDNAMHYDTQFAEALTDHLFAEAGKFGRDLPSINIQRGRDHGIPSYLDHRRFCGLSVSKTFEGLEDISPATRAKLKEVYKSTEDIDLFVGGISEVPRDSSSGIPGPTFSCIISYQVRDLRRGDGFWFENGGANAKFTFSQLESIKKVSLSRIICDVGENITTIQPKAMLQHTLESNARVKCSSLSQLDLTPFQEKDGKYVETQLNSGNDKDNEWSSWFPYSVSCQRRLPLKPAPILLRHLMIYRRDDICDDVIGTEMRSVNGFFQVRYKCRPGTIKATDFPPVDSSHLYWTTWSNQDEPTYPYFDDNENISGSGACLNPVAIQAQTINGVPARETGDVFEIFSPFQGLFCKGIHQLSGKCSNYRIRFLCLRDNCNNL